MAGKDRAGYMRDYRRRKREERERNQGGPVTPPVTPLAPPVLPVDRAVTPLARPRVTRRAVTPPATPPRRVRMKSDTEIRNHIANLMRMQGQNPLALLHLLTGYVTQLQDLMKRDRMDELAEAVCEHRHPGKLAASIYCKLCHDVEMAGKFGSIPGQGGNQLIYKSGDDQLGAEAVPEGGISDEEILLGGVNIKPLPGGKE